LLFGGGGTTTRIFEREKKGKKGEKGSRHKVSRKHGSMNGGSELAAEKKKGEGKRFVAEYL